MGCGNCSTGAGGKPGGCKGNGGCSTGGCNRMNVFDWLNALPLHDTARPYPIIEVSFNRGSRKEFYKNNTQHILEKGDWITVEGVGGYDVGQVSITGELVKLQLKKYSVRETDVSKRVLHMATADELEQCSRQKDREPEVLVRSRAIARAISLDMKICEVEIQADSKKGTFFYTADQRVDFRELIKTFAGDFKMKVEMRQIGARQESGKVGGIGSCGRELCCSTWLTDFKSVNTTAARYQNLSINQTKLSGQCGRLKCCLNYELDTYMDALAGFPDHVEHLETVKGVAHLQKKDIFKNLMWYSYSDNNKQYPLSIARVKEIKELNKQGQKADELQPVELETRESKAGIKADMGYVNDVGQISLKALEKNSKKKKQGGNKPQGDGNKPQGNKPPQGEGAPQQARREKQPQKAAAGQQPAKQQPGQQQKNKQKQRPNKEQPNADAPNTETPNDNVAPPDGAAPQTAVPQDQTQNRQPANKGQQGNRQQQGPKSQQGNRPPNAAQPQRPPRQRGPAAEGEPKAEGGEGEPQQPRSPRPPRPNRPQQPRPDRPERTERPERPQEGAGPVEA